MDFPPVACLLLAIVVLPAWLFWLCMRMSDLGVTDPPYLQFFFVFGSFGGWLLAYGLGPGGLAGISIIFLITLAPIAILASAASLWSVRSFSRYHAAAFYGSLSYIVFLFGLLLVGWALSGG